jgi:hypothetical protein
MRNAKKSIVKRALRFLAGGLALFVAISMAAFVIAWHLFPFPMERLQQWPASPVVLDAKGNRLFSVVGRDE